MFIFEEFRKVINIFILVLVGMLENKIQSIKPTEEEQTRSGKDNENIKKGDHVHVRHLTPCKLTRSAKAPVLCKLFIKY